jgi:sarcosine oxidase
MAFEGVVLHHPDGGRCLARAAVRAFQDRAAAHGADVRFGTGPAEIVVSGDEAEVRTAGEAWRAPAVVITAGGWLPKLVGERVGLPPLRVTREQVHHFRPRAEGAGDAWPSFIHHRQPWTYGLFTPGEGFKVAEHHVGPEVDPDDGADAIDAALRERIVPYVERWFPGVDPDPVFMARCLYTTTPNEDFVLDRRGPLVIGSPCSGHGFKFTPEIGRILADLADGRPGPGGRFALRP